MKNQWPVWVFIITVIVVVLFALNYEGGKKVPLKDIFSEDVPEQSSQIEFEYVVEKPMAAEEEVQVPAPSALPSTKAVPVGQPVTQVTQPSVPAVVVPATPDGDVADFSQVSYTIQAASYREKDKALRGLKLIKDKGHDAYLTMKELKSGGVWYRVYIGKYSSQDQAQQNLETVRKDFKDSFIISPK